MSREPIGAEPIGPDEAKDWVTRAEGGEVRAMNDEATPYTGEHDDRRGSLPDEPGIPNVAERKAGAISRKGLLAVVLLVGSLVTVAGVSITRFVASGKKPDDGAGKRVADRPAATGELRRLDMSAAAASSNAAASTTSAGVPRVPALQPTAEEMAEPIGVRRTGQATPPTGGTRPTLPEDSPAMLVITRPGAAIGRTGASQLGVSGSDAGPGEATPAGGAGPLDETRRNLQGYQRQLQGMMDNLTRVTAAAASQGSGASILAGGIPSPGRSPSLAPLTAGTNSGAPAGGGLFGGQLQGSATPKVEATLLGNRSLTLPKGTAFTCALKTRVVSAASGFVSCIVQRNVYSENGRVLLVERGSHLDGEYRIASVKPGTVRIPVLWTRIRTPNAVTVDIESPGTGPLGESGIDGYVDNRWVERIGAAMLLSLIDDSVKLVIQHQANQTSGTGDTLVLPSTTANSSKLAEKVLDSTINIPPLIYQNQGGIVGIYVARDVDFSAVYALQPVEREERP